MDFSGIDLGKISEVLNSLSPEDMESLQKAAESIMHGGESEKSQGEAQNTASPFGDIDPQMLIKIMSIFEKLKASPSDPAVNLIYALKPLLSQKRQKKADMAAEMLKLLSLKDILF
ncbi:MAG: hypothetical protein ACI4GC_04250 [Acutalibacteraceae bacterium]